jgi:hypothetical protein
VKRLIIMIAAALSFGVTAAYATTAGHSGSATPKSHESTATSVFSLPATGDRAATHDQGDDNGLDQPAEPADRDDVGDDNGGATTVNHDPANHDAGDDNSPSNDDPASHDAGDDNSHGSDDPASHDAGDDRSHGNDD